jgi:hypothetical protein
MNNRLHRDTDGKKPTGYYSDKQEKKVAKAIRGKQTSNSGATPFDKGDVTDNDWLIECKTRTKESDSITVKKDWIEKNLAESIYMKKDYNALVINCGPDSDNYYIIDETTFLEMKEALEKVKQMEEHL